MVRLSVDEKADFFEAARASGTNLSTWARAHLRLAAISELSRMGKEPKFLGRKAPRGPGYKIANPPRRFAVPKAEPPVAPDKSCPEPGQIVSGGSVTAVSVVDVPTERVQTAPQVSESIAQPAAAPPAQPAPPASAPFIARNAVVREESWALNMERVNAAKKAAGIPVAEAPVERPARRTVLDPGQPVRPKA